MSIKPNHITKILVANRGEIARRIFRTAHQMGIGTVAIYANSDVGAPFIRDADIAIALDGSSATETYLDIKKVIAACKTSNADAVHPGYGFLSENTQFAQAVIDAGLTWIGPPPNSIAQIGDKLAAKAMLKETEIPSLMAIELDESTDAFEAAEKIGYPVLVKASAGGGGRGMRVVEKPNILESAVEGARREAASAFRDSTVFLERWLESTRHIEVQILGDLHGNMVYLFERECSVQRRHQKVIEEAPSTAVDDELRKQLGEAAVTIARQLGYASAGTVEFLVSGHSFWFLEVNTRLQVEHPITEEITGLDLVREQIRVAQEEHLGYSQEDLSIHGHAIEARLYAEDPANDFLPAAGRLNVWKPSSLARFDDGVEQGSVIGVDFDPLIAKVITHAPTRTEAVAKLARALSTTQIQGLRTNRDFLIASLRTPEFLQGDTTTDFIPRVNPTRELVPAGDQLNDAAISVAIVIQQQATESQKSSLMSDGNHSFSLPQLVKLTFREIEISVEYRKLSDTNFIAKVDNTTYPIEINQLEGENLDLTIHDRNLKYCIYRCPDSVWYVHNIDGDLELKEQPKYELRSAHEWRGGLTAPMPGRILATEVNAGDSVKSGQLLMIVEAMKLEHRIIAPNDGILSAVLVNIGDQVEKDDVLVEMSKEQ